MHRDKHLNIFFGYEQGKLGTPEGRLALENNLTRALILVLEKTNPQDVLRSFLRSVVGRDFAASVDRRIHFFLQSKPSAMLLDNLVDSKKVLLGVAPIELSDKKWDLNDPIAVDRADMRDDFKTLVIKFRDSLDASERTFRVDSFNKYIRDEGNNLGKKAEIRGRGSLEPFVSYLDYLVDCCGGSRPDGWIISPNRFAIAIESKIVGPLYRPQLKRHLRDSLGLDEKVDYRHAVRTKTWPDVLEWAQRLIMEKGLHSDSDYWLIDEFIKYLKVNRMSKQLDFEDRHFNAFYPDGDQDDREEAATWLEGICKAFVNDRKFKRIRSRYVPYPDKKGQEQYFNAFNINLGSYFSVCQLRALGGKKSVKPVHNLNVSFGINENGIEASIWMKHKKLRQHIGKQARWKTNEEFGDALWRKIEELPYSTTVSLKRAEFLKGKGKGKDTNRPMETTVLEYHLGSEYYMKKSKFNTYMFDNQGRKEVVPGEGTDFDRRAPYDSLIRTMSQMKKNFTLSVNVSLPRSYVIAKTKQGIERELVDILFRLEKVLSIFSGIPNPT
jgi:hypothetical protein